jgi:cellulose synthase operon protein C
MMGFDGVDLPPPKDWQKFERLCRDLWEVIWEDSNTQMNGRNGQEQAGVDIFGTRRRDGKLSGVQCKRRNLSAYTLKFQQKNLRDAVQDAKSFVPSLRGEFILAHTGKRDTKTQEVARQIAAEHDSSGEFEVYVYSWDDIQEKLCTYPALLLKHYPWLNAAALTLAAQIPAGFTQLGDSTRAHIGPEASQLVMLSHVADRTWPLEAEHQAEIEMIRTLLAQGLPGAALAQALALRARIWNSCAGATRARLLVLLGHSQFELGNTPEAAKYLMEAATHAPTDAAIQAQVALGHSLAENIAAARHWAHKSLEQDPTNIVAVQVAAIHDERSDEDIVLEHERNIGIRAELYVAVGHRAANRRDIAVARKWFERAIEVNNACPEFLAVAGQAIVDSVHMKLSARYYLSSDARRDLMRAVSLLDNAIKPLVDEGARRARVSWYVARLVAKRMLHAPDAADAAEHALQSCGFHTELIHLRAAIASEAGDHRKVVELLDALPPPRTIDDMGLLAAAYGGLGRYDRCIDNLRALLARPDLGAVPDLLTESQMRSVT